MILKGFAVALLGIAFNASLAQSTWSILALDKDTGRIGVASNTCITLSSFYPRFLEETFVYVPAKGAVVAQAWYTDPSLLEEAKSLIQNGTTGEEVLQTFAKEERCFNPFLDIPEVQCSADNSLNWPLVDQNQYGIVLAGEANATTYTGKDLNDIYAIVYGQPPSEQSGMVGIVDGIQFSVQGNIVEIGTVAATFGNFTSGPDLPQQLLTALAAGAQPGLGDVRCTQDDRFAGKTALVGFLYVIEPDGTLSVNITAVSDESETRDVVDLLQDSLNRVDYVAKPCGKR